MRKGEVVLSIAICLILLCASGLLAGEEGQNGPERDQFLKASDWLYDKLIDEEAPLHEREFAARTLRFAVRGTPEDFEAIAVEINRAFADAIEFGRSNLRFVLTESYVERAKLYFDITQDAAKEEEGREALDTVLKAIFYDSNNWLYWAAAAYLYTLDWENKAIYAPLKAELYGKMAVALNPRDPYAYRGLVASYFLRENYSEANTMASKALEICKFEDAYSPAWRGDEGRCYFIDYKGRCFLRMGDLRKAQEYLQTAVTLGRPKADVQPYLTEALAPFFAEALELKLDESGRIGYNSTQEAGQATITEITADSPAEAAGLQVGDVIVEVDGLSAVDAKGKSRMVEARDEIIAGTLEKALVEVHRGEQVLYFIMCK